MNGDVVFEGGIRWGIVQGWKRRGGCEMMGLVGVGACTRV